MSERADHMAEFGVFSAGPLELPEAELPEWLHLVPASGTWRGHWSGNVIEITAERLQTLVANFNRRGIDLMVDWEHESMRGMRAPAAGWVDRVELRAEGLFGHVKAWTPTAAAQLKAREYRYLSPTILFRALDRVTGVDQGWTLHSAALTNDPFFHELDAVVAAQRSPLMHLVMLAALGLPEDATEDQAVQAIKDLTEFRDAAKSELGLEQADGAGVAAAATELRESPDPALVKFHGLAADAGPAELRKAVMDQHRQLVMCANALDINPAELTDEAIQEKVAVRLQADVDRVIADAYKAGKLTKPMEPWAREYATRDLGAFQAYIKVASPAVPVKSPFKGNNPDNKPSALTEAEQAVCKATGLTPERFNAGRKEA